MEKPYIRKPRLYFDVGANPNNVTFDDGDVLRRNIPWLHYVEARWEYAELDTIKVDIGDWLVVLSGHNLEPLFQAIEEHTLLRVRAQVGWKTDSEERMMDTFVKEIRFLKPPARTPGKRRGQTELNLGLPAGLV